MKTTSIGPAFFSGQNKHQEFIEKFGDKGINLEIPNECPICHLKMIPIKVTGYYNDNKIQLIWLCVNHDCSEYFIATYNKTNEVTSYSSNISKPGGLEYISYKLMNTSPIKYMKINFPQCICNLSPSFVEIYNQAMEAESKGLDQIAGMGLRKALEFLVKDYAIKNNPNDKNKISSIKYTLNTCIQDYISNPKLKSCAERATWLGNDETHYKKRWGKEDITHLITLIKLTINCIENDYLIEFYKEDMPDNH